MFLKGRNSVEGNKLNGTGYHLNPAIVEDGARNVGQPSSMGYALQFSRKQ